MARKVSKKKVKTVAPKLSSTKVAPMRGCGVKDKNSSGHNASTSIIIKTKSPKSSAAKKLLVEKEEQPTSIAANNSRATRSRGVQSSRTNAKKTDSSLIDKTLTIEIKRISEKPVGSKRTTHRSLKIELEPVLSKKRHVVDDDADDKKQTTNAKTLRKRNVNNKSEEITSRRVMDRARKPQKYYEDDGNDDLDDDELMDGKNGASEDDNSDVDYMVPSGNNSAKPSKKKLTLKKVASKKKKSKTAKKSSKANKVDGLSVECSKMETLGNGSSSQQVDNKPDFNANNSSSSDENSLLKRSYISNANFPSKNTVENVVTLQSTTSGQHEDENSFTIASYNILADCHAQRDYKTSTWVTNEELSINSRHERIMQEVKFIDADVYCFQEVGTEYFRDVLKDSMNRLGYDGVYVARLWKEAPYKEGEATFYRTSAFQLLQHKNLILEEFAKKEIDSLNVSESVKDSMKQSVESYAVSLLTQLKSVSGQFMVTVANVHICYDEFKRQDKQCLQVAMTVRELQKLANDIHNSSNNDINNDIPSSQIICGDFNSWPTSGPQRLIRDGRLDEGCAKSMMAIDTVKMDDGKMTSLFSQWNDAFHFDPSHSYQSAYQVVSGSDPHTSRFNMDGEVRQVDFIYFSSDTLIPRKVMAVPEKSDLQNGVPNAIYPSDHVSIVAEFTVSE